jgi:hypothetical protein
VYEKLDTEHIVRTVERLARRIDERFPTASLNGVAKELERVTRLAADRTEHIRRPNLTLRIGVGLLMLGVGVVLVLTIPEIRVSWKIQAIDELVQTIEGLLGSLFFIGTGILFLVTLEGRLKRSKALAAVHELRSLAHIVDMHQLTKDPEELATLLPPTASSPQRTMSDIELVRYLDYCTEMLALISKVGALYVQRYADPVVLSAVDEIEDLTSGLSRKIWQKMTMLNQARARAQDETRSAALPSAARPRLLGAGTAGAKARSRRRR